MLRYMTRTHLDSLEALAGKPLALPPPQRIPSRRGGTVEVWTLETVRAAIVAAWLTQ